jgi:dTMP kinase
MRGKLFVIEGGDGCGKQTQSRLLVDAIKKMGAEAIYTDEPSAGGLGDRIRADLASTGTHLSARTLQILFTGDRSQHVEEVIEPALEKGMHVVADRYWPSTVAYGSALGMKKEEVEALININFGMFPKPDMVFILDLAPDTAAKRVQARGRQIDRHEKDMKLQTALRQTYKELAKRFGDGWHVIDASRTKEEIHREIMSFVEKSLKA